jgi:hypothetical protein
MAVNQLSDKLIASLAKLNSTNQVNLRKFPVPGREPLAWRKMLRSSENLARKSGHQKT